MFKNLKISTKISIGFAMITIILVSVVVITFMQIKSYGFFVNRIIDIRLPTVLNTSRSINGINHSLAALRGWMLLGKNKFKIEREKAWKDEIDITITKMAEVSKNWTNPENLKRFENARELMNNFKDHQLKIMALLKTKDNLENKKKMDAAKKILATKAAPTAFEIKKILKAMEKDQLRLANIDSNDARAEESLLKTTMIFLAVAAIILAVIFNFFITRSVSHPIMKTREYFQAISEGKLDNVIEIHGNDELGQLLKALQAMQTNLNNILSQVAVATQQVQTGSKQISETSQSLSQGASEQAASLEQITSSITELSSQTKQAATNSNEANTLSNNVLENADIGNERMNEMVLSMTEINKASGNIAKIIKVIDEIAFQTNLLALNAAVEAARAGKYGKGFAVVAEEVRNLASRSASAAKETADIIDESIKKAQNGSKIAEETLATFKDIVKGINESVKLVNEISLASNEQVKGISQVEKALQQIDQVTQQNAANAEESAASSEELSSQAVQLAQMIGKFQLAKINGNGMPQSFNNRGEAKIQSTINNGNGNVQNRQYEGSGQITHGINTNRNERNRGQINSTSGQDLSPVTVINKKPSDVISLEDDDKEFSQF